MYMYIYSSDGGGGKRARAVIKALVLAVPDCVGGATRDLYVTAANRALSDCGLANRGQEDGRLCDVVCL